ncbi:ABC transporter permease [Chungangia koreensis]|uniref:ABC transporter permease n=1 Tax=Chungangia koreensis TaxID=752657 RepID=A0ABV8X944_9LACT
MRDFWIIFKQSFMTKLGTKSFIITTGVMVAAIFLMANMSSIIDTFKSMDGNDRDDIVYVSDETGSLFEPLKQQLAVQEADFKIEQTEESNDALKTKVKEAKIDSFLVLAMNEEGTINASYTSESASEMEKPLAFQEALQSLQTTLQASQLQLTAEQVSQLFAPIEFEQNAVSPNSKTEEELSTARGLVYVLIFVIYFAVFAYSMMIATEVATEKSSRVMEILISSVSPVKHMFAKIAGIGTLGLLQMALFGIVGYIALKTSAADMSEGFFSVFGFSNVNPSTIGYAIVYFLLGYFLYATLAALLGSLVSRTEDVQQLLAPMSFLIIIAAFIAFSGLGNPEAAYVTYTSYFPFFTPMVMFLRVGMLDLPIWEPILSIIILLVTIFLLGWFGAKVYKGGVLMYGPSRNLKDIKKAVQLGKE